MVGKVIDLPIVHDADHLATLISEEYTRWNSSRREWLNEKRELRNYIFATDTTSTTNSKNPWSNKTVRPKLTQIRDNLHANYMMALFPSDKWFKWKGYTFDDETRKKIEAIESYMMTKTRATDFRQTLSQLLLDYIDYGNAFATVEFVNEYHDTPEGERVIGFVGPRLVRISPTDLVFNPIAARFEDSPKILRVVTTMGEIEYDIEHRPEKGYLVSALQKMKDFRSEIMSMDEADIEKIEAFRVDGFGSLSEYYRTGTVEILEFMGDIYDQNTGTYKKNRLITIMDRRYILRDEPNPAWYGKSNVVHAGWRKRPDNLYAMGPLDNLVGLQYRINHLENLKADVFDMIAYPMLKVHGNVEEFSIAPNEMVFCGDDGDVKVLGWDATALNADIQIAQLEASMEDMAGAPRNQMGIRTPGEKTAFEVQTLENAASRIFQEKIQQFELELLEPILNMMLEAARRNMDGFDVVRVLDDDFGVEAFLKVTKEDLTASGKLYPIGARHFAMRAQLVQNLNGVFNSPIGQIIAPHVSSKQLAQMVEDLFAIGKFDLIRPNVAIFEQMETQKLINQAQEEVEVAAATPTDIEEELIGG